jgi:hypothetical protein
LLYEADELAAETDKKLSQLSGQWEKSLAHAAAEIVVAETAHAGATIRFAGVETTLKSPYRGPLIFAPRHAREFTEIVLIDPATKKTTPLPTIPLHDNGLHTLYALLGHPHKAAA